MWNQETQPRRAVGAQPAPAAPPTTSSDPRTTARIGTSVVIKGDVSSAEDLIIDGRVEGTITLGNYRLTVGVNAAIQAELRAHTISISGVVKGNVIAIETIELRETGSVEGEIRAPRFAMRDGAVLRGRVDTRPLTATAHDSHRPEFPIAV